MSNEDVELNVSDELQWDPKVDNAAIAVSADGGVVTLRGTVGSLRHEAVAAAWAAPGVTRVEDEILVAH